MPSRTPRPCTALGCTHLQPCPDHPRIRPEDHRPSATQRGYGYAWARRSAEFLAAHPICIDCGERATQADHEPSRRRLVEQGIEDPDADQYLRPRCWSCHSRKTATKDGGYGNKGRVN